VIVELHALEVFGYHGVLPEEARDGQTFLVDVELEVDEPASDRIEDAVDYRQVAATVGDVSDVTAFLEERLRFAVEAGIEEERICLDPGIGFGKTVEHNVELVRRLDVLLGLGRPVLIGLSRKSTLGRLVGDEGATTGSTMNRQRRWQCSCPGWYAHRPARAGSGSPGTGRPPLDCTRRRNR